MPSIIVASRRHAKRISRPAALACAFPAVPLLARAAAGLAVLAEMTAADEDVRRRDPAGLCQRPSIRVAYRAR